MPRISARDISEGVRALSDDVAAAVTRSVSRNMGKSFTKIGRLIRDGNFNEAEAELRELDFTEALNRPERRIRRFAQSLALLGAGAVDSPENSIWGKGAPFPDEVDKGAVNQVMNFSAHRMNGEVKRNLERRMDKAKRFQKAQSLVKAEAIDPDKLGKDINKYLRGETYRVVNATSNLVGTRLAAYGMLHEARVRGIVRYRIDAVLDSRTTAICRNMNGRIMSVEPAFTTARTLLQIQDPSNLAKVAPWPGAVEELEGRADAELQQAGYQLPPFHYLCRSVVTLVSTEATVSPQDKGGYTVDRGATAAGTAVAGRGVLSVVFDELRSGGEEAVQQAADSFVGEIMNDVLEENDLYRRVFQGSPAPVIGVLDEVLEEFVDYMTPVAFGTSLRSRLKDKFREKDAEWRIANDEPLALPPPGETLKLPAPEQEDVKLLPAPEIEKLEMDIDEAVAKVAAVVEESYAPNVPPSAVGIDVNSTKKPKSSEMDTEPPYVPKNIAAENKMLGAIASKPIIQEAYPELATPDERAKAFMKEVIDGMDPSLPQDVALTDSIGNVLVQRTGKGAITIMDDAMDLIDVMDNGLKPKPIGPTGPAAAAAVTDDAPDAKPYAMPENGKAGDPDGPIDPNLLEPENILEDGTTITYQVSDVDIENVFNGVQNIETNELIQQTIIGKFYNFEHILGTIYTKLNQAGNVKLNEALFVKMFKEEAFEIAQLVDPNVTREFIDSFDEDIKDIYAGIVLMTNPPAEHIEKPSLSTSALAANWDGDDVNFELFNEPQVTKRQMQSEQDSVFFSMLEEIGVEEEILTDLQSMNRNIYPSIIREEVPNWGVGDELLGPRDYSGSMYHIINETLRENRQAMGSTRLAIERIDQVFAYESSTLREDKVLWRGLNEEWKDLRKSRLDIGVTYQDDAFVSTTMDRDFAKKWAGSRGVVFQMIVPKGTPAIYLDSFSVNQGDEVEVLLPRGSQVRIVNIMWNERPVRIQAVYVGKGDVLPLEYLGEVDLPEPTNILKDEAYDPRGKYFWGLDDLREVPLA